MRFGPVVPILRGARVILRPVQDSDVEARMALGYDPEITRCHGGQARANCAMTLQEAAAWVDAIKSYRDAWIIDVGGLIGHIRLHGHVMAERRAALAIGIDDPASLGKGLGTEAIRLMAAYAFDHLQLRRLTLRVIDFNERAIKSYQSCGFVIAGRERRAGLIDGTAHDDIMMSLQDSDFRRLAPDRLCDRS